MGYLPVQNKIEMNILDVYSSTVLKQCLPTTTATLTSANRAPPARRASAARPMFRTGVTNGASSSRRNAAR